MRPNASLKNIEGLREGGSWIHNDAKSFWAVGLYDKYCITLNIGFPKNLSKWDDFNYILVLDEEFGQPYIPFYAYLDGTWQKRESPVLNQIIKNYNTEMRKLPFLEEIKEERI